MVIVSMGQEQVVPLIMGATLGDEAVGGLRAGQYLLGITHFLMMAMENFIPRQASEHFTAGGHKALRNYLMRQTVLIGSATLALILALAIPAEFWMGRVFGADEAASMGLVTRVVADGRVVEEAYDTARRIADGAPLVARWHQKFMRRLEDPQPLSETELDEGYACYGTEDFRIGTASFLAKNKPRFEGR